MEANVNMDENGKNHNFSNPMYDAMGTIEVSDQASNKGLYEVPLDVNKKPPDYSGDTLASNGNPPPPKLAVLSPSAMLQKSSPNIHLRQKELSPSAADTGEDTQKLVVEDENSEC